MVQVRHPKVKERMFLDFLLMKKIASFADRNPSLKWMNLGPSMEQFSNTMSAQVGCISLWTCDDCALPRVKPKVPNSYINP